MNGRTGKEKALVIKYIIGTVLVAAFFVGIIFAFYNKLYEEKRASIKKDGELSAIQAADLLEDYLYANIDSIKLTGYALDQMLAENRSESEIQDYLVAQSTALISAVNENSSGIYGCIKGRFYSGTNWEPPEGYDAKSRPWYTRPLEDPGELTVLDPYLDLQTGNMMLALGKTLRDGESVISVDLSLDRVQLITENATLFENADTEMILNERGVVIAHSDIGEAGKDYGSETGTFGAAVFEKLRSTNDDCFELNFGNRHYIIYAAEIQNDWDVISVMDTTEVFGQLNILFILTVAAAFVIIVIIAAIMINSGKRQLMAEQLNGQLSSTADIYISLHEINFITDTFSVVRSTNKEADKIVGKSRHNCQELIRKIMETCSDPSSRDEILDFVDFTTLNHRLKDCSTITSEFLSVDKKWRRARFIVSERVPSGKVARAIYLVEDIDRERRERDQAQEAVRLMNTQISSVANIYFSMHDIDLQNDTFNEIKTRVQKVTDLIGGRREHAQSVMYAVMDQMADDSSRRTIHEFVDLSTLNERLKKTNTITEEFLSIKGVWSRARFVVSERAPDGTVEHVLWLVEGIDAEKRRRDKLINMSERAIAANEAKSSFMSKVSHNIRIPINSILGMNELILRECGDKSIREYSENIRTSGAMLLGLVNDILDITSIEEGRAQITAVEYDISCLISDLVNMIQPEADRKGLKLSIETDSSMPRLLRGDEVHIKQAVMNLLTYAVNTTNKGDITFCVNYDEIPGSSGDLIVLDIAVKDTGMKPVKLGELLSGGDGEENTDSLVLIIAEGLLKVMGSTINAESMYGEGAVLFFRIKQEAVSREPLGDYDRTYRRTLEKRSTYREKFRAPGANALIVDDVPVNLMLTQKLLDRTEIHTDSALSGEQAVKLAKEKKYDVIILDQSMPGMSGVETLRAIRADEDSPNVGTPAICLTANAVFGAREQYINEGFDDYLTKPLDPDKLEELLIKYLPDNKIMIM
ncbi:MAG: response regulator [Ruminiclostridium sp.]|nr:response regulator [Ruminiclostridium sp.]